MPACSLPPPTLLGPAPGHMEAGQPADMAPARPSGTLPGEVAGRTAPPALSAVEAADPDSFCASLWRSVSRPGGIFRCGAGSNLPGRAHPGRGSRRCCKPSPPVNRLPGQIPPLAKLLYARASRRNLRAVQRAQPQGMPLLKPGWLATAMARLRLALARHRRVGTRHPGRTLPAAAHPSPSAQTCASLQLRHGASLPHQPDRWQPAGGGVQGLRGPGLSVPAVRVGWCEWAARPRGKLRPGGCFSPCAASRGSDGRSGWSGLDASPCLGTPRGRRAAPRAAPWASRRGILPGLRCLVTTATPARGESFVGSLGVCPPPTSRPHSALRALRAAGRPSRRQCPSRLSATAGSIHGRLQCWHPRRRAPPGPRSWGAACTRPPWRRTPSTR